MHKRNEKLHIAEYPIAIYIVANRHKELHNNQNRENKRSKKRNRNKENVCKGCKNGLMHAK